MRVDALLQQPDLAGVVDGDPDVVVAAAHLLHRLPQVAQRLADGAGGEQGGQATDQQRDDDEEDDGARVPGPPGSVGSRNSSSDADHRDARWSAPR